MPAPRDLDRGPQYPEVLSKKYDFRLRALRHRADVERQLDDELRFHLEREGEKYESLGMSA